LHNRSSERITTEIPNLTPTISTQSRQDATFLIFSMTEAARLPSGRMARLKSLAALRLCVKILASWLSTPVLDLELLASTT
jgi:hypothetical protein